MKRISLILFLFLSSISLAYSQSSITWQKIYANPTGYPYDIYGWNVCPADNDNFYFISKLSVQPHGTWVIKVNPYGDTIWNKLIDTIKATAGVSTGDGDCIITGIPCNTVKLNSFGNVIWSHTYLNYGIPRKIIKSRNNTYILCGYNYFKAMLIKIDSLGNLIWEKEYNLDYSNDFRNVTEAYNAGYLAAGIIRNTPIEDYGGVDRIDNSGNLIWEKRYTYSGTGIDFAAIKQFNGGYLITGSGYDTSISQIGLYLMKIDTSGNTIFSKFFPEDDSVQLQPWDVNVINNNRILLTGELDTLIGWHQWWAYPTLIITDSVGNIIRSKINRPNMVNFTNSFVINNNSIITIGNYYDSTIYPWYYIYGIRTDTNLNFPPIGIEKLSNKVPITFKLYQNYPNPFNPITKIKFDIPISQSPLYERGGGGFVILKIYDLLGREVSTLVNEQLKPGSYNVDWDASNFASGVYFYSLIIDNRIIESRKMLLIK